MRITRILQIVVGVVGFLSAFGSAFLGRAFGWSPELSAIVSLGLGIGTIGIELTIAFGDLREEITKLYPSLDFSVSEQRQIFSLISSLNKLRKSKGPAAGIALRLQAGTTAVIEKAAQGSDFEVDNMFAANLEAMRTLKPGQRFIGISAIINPDHWQFDQDLLEYKRLNFQQASIGVNVSRTFVLKDQSEVEAMMPIMREQAEHGIDVAYVLADDVPRSTYFGDFTVLPDHSFALYVPKLEKLLTCVATQSPTLVADLEQTAARIRQRAVSPQAISIPLEVEA